MFASAFSILAVCRLEQHSASDFVSAGIVFMLMGDKSRACWNRTFASRTICDVNERIGRSRSATHYLHSREGSLTDYLQRQGAWNIHTAHHVTTTTTRTDAFSKRRRHTHVRCPRAAHSLGLKKASRLLCLGSAPPGSASTGGASTTTPRCHSFSLRTVAAAPRDERQSTDTNLHRCGGHANGPQILP